MTHLQVEAVINAAAAGLQPDVYTVSFSGDDVTIVAVYKVSLDGATTDDQITAIFNALVTAATNDTLIPGETVIAGSVAFDDSKSIMTSLVAGGELRKIAADSHDVIHVHM